MPLAINSIICIYMCIEIYLYIYLFMYIYRQIDRYRLYLCVCFCSNVFNSGLPAANAKKKHDNNKPCLIGLRIRSGLQDNSARAEHCYCLKRYPPVLSDHLCFMMIFHRKFLNCHSASPMISISPAVLYQRRSSAKTASNSMESSGYQSAGNLGCRTIKNHVGKITS